jgi:hypothetical protein
MVRGLVAVSWAMTSPTVLMAQGEVRGRLLSAQGYPIPGVTISIGDIGFSLKSDSLGWFSISGAPGAGRRLQFTAGGYRQDLASFMLGGSPIERDFTLAATETPAPKVNPSGSVLRGRVVDESGQPSSYASMQLNYGRRFVSDDSGR